MSIVTSRIASNVVVHGLSFAVRIEIERFHRSGFGREAAVTAGIEAVKVAIRHAGLVRK